MNAATLHEWAIMVHDATQTTGQVVETVYPADGDQMSLAQVLVRKDGTRCKFLLIELRYANEAEAKQFLYER